MSSLHTDKSWLFVSFMLAGKRVRLYPGLSDNRENRRSKLVKEIVAWIESRDWTALARRFPECKGLVDYRDALPENSATFRQVSERFLKHQENANSAATLEYYNSIFKTNVWPQPIADKPIRLITAGDIMELLGGLRKLEHIARANKVRGAVATVFNWARGERGADGNYFVTENPVSRTKALKVILPDDDIDPFDAVEKKNIIAAAHPGRERNYVTVAFEAGLRPAENSGLKRANIDLKARVIYIRQNYSRFGEGPLKTLRSRRTVDMTDACYRALKAQLDDVRLKSDWVWPDLYHKTLIPLNAHNFSRRNWQDILTRAEVEHREFYQTRHTFAVLLRDAGAQWDYIADQMGHANMAMIVRYYLKFKQGKPQAPKLKVVK